MNKKIAQKIAKKILRPQSDCQIEIIDQSQFETILAEVLHQIFRARKKRVRNMYLIAKSLLIGGNLNMTKRQAEAIYRIARRPEFSVRLKKCCIITSP